ncbi:MAG: hypothetical protein WC175_02155 [Candidatus Dojkabacteria bacterium]
MSAFRKKYKKNKKKVSKFDPQSASKKKKSLWLLNVGKSILKAVPEVITDELPETKDAISGFKENFMEGGSLSETIGAFRTAASYLKTRTWDEGVKVATKNAWDSLKSGDFSQENEDDFGMDFDDDFSFDEDDGFKEDNDSDFGSEEDEEDSSSSFSSTNIKSQNIVGLGFESSKSLARVEQMSSLKVSTGVSMMLGRNILSMLNVLHTDLKVFYSFANNATLSFYNATNMYQSAMLTAQEKQINSLEEIKSLLEDANEFSGIKSAKERYQNSEDNVKTLKEKLMGTLDEFIGEGSILSDSIKPILQNPIKFLAKKGVNKLLFNKESKRLIGDIDNIMANLPLALVRQIESWEGSGSMFKEGIFSLVNKRAKDSKLDQSLIDPKKRLIKGPVPFDGDTKQSIIEVIPSLLSKIHNATLGVFRNTSTNKSRELDDGDELIYDYEVGKFIKKSKIRKQLKSQLSDKIMSEFSTTDAGGNLVDKTKISADYDNMSEKEQKHFDQTLSSFILQFAKDPKFLDAIPRDDFGFFDASALEEIIIAKNPNFDRRTLKHLVRTINSLNASQVLSLSASMVKSNKTVNNYLEKEFSLNPLSAHLEDTKEDLKVKMPDLLHKFSKFSRWKIDYDAVKNITDRKVEEETPKLYKEYMTKFSKDEFKHVSDKEKERYWENDKDEVIESYRQKVYEEELSKIDTSRQLSKFVEIYGDKLSPKNFEAMVKKYEDFTDRSKEAIQLFNKDIMGDSDEEIFYSSERYKEMLRRGEKSADGGLRGLVENLLRKVSGTASDLALGKYDEDDQMVKTLGGLLGDDFDGISEKALSVLKFLGIKKGHPTSGSTDKGHENNKSGYFASGGYAEEGIGEYADGGSVRGKTPKEDTEDNLHVKLTKGEFVLNKKTTSIINTIFGKDFLKTLNRSKDKAGIRDFFFSRFGKVDASDTEMRTPTDNSIKGILNLIRIDVAKIAKLFTYSTAKIIKSLDSFKMDFSNLTNIFSKFKFNSLKKGKLNRSGVSSDTEEQTLEEGNDLSFLQKMFDKLPGGNLILSMLNKLPKGIKGGSKKLLGMGKRSLEMGKGLGKTMLGGLSSLWNTGKESFKSAAGGGLDLINGGIAGLGKVGGSAFKAGGSVLSALATLLGSATKAGANSLEGLFKGINKRFSSRSASSEEQPTNEGNLSGKRKFSSTNGIGILSDIREGIFDIYDILNGNSLSKLFIGTKKILGNILGFGGDILGKGLNIGRRLFSKGKAGFNKGKDAIYNKFSEKKDLAKNAYKDTEGTKSERLLKAILVSVAPSNVGNSDVKGIDKDSGLENINTKILQGKSKDRKDNPLKKSFNEMKEKLSDQLDKIKKGLKKMSPKAYDWLTSKLGKGGKLLRSLGGKAAGGVKALGGKAAGGLKALGGKAAGALGGKAAAAKMAGGLGGKAAAAKMAGALGGKAAGGLMAGGKLIAGAAPALLSNPVGWAVLGTAAVVGGIAVWKKHKDRVKKFELAYAKEKAGQDIQAMMSEWPPKEQKAYLKWREKKTKKEYNKDKDTSRDGFWGKLGFDNKKGFMYNAGKAIATGGVIGMAVRGVVNRKKEIEEFSNVRQLIFQKNPESEAKAKEVIDGWSTEKRERYAKWLKSNTGEEARKAYEKDQKLKKFLVSLNPIMRVGMIITEGVKKVKNIMNRDMLFKLYYDKLKANPNDSTIPPFIRSLSDRDRQKFQDYLKLRARKENAEEMSKIDKDGNIRKVKATALELESSKYVGKTGLFGLGKHDVLNKKGEKVLFKALDNLILELKTLPQDEALAKTAKWVDGFASDFIGPVSNRSALFQKIDARLNNLFASFKDGKYNASISGSSMNIENQLKNSVNIRGSKAAAAVEDSIERTVKGTKEFFNDAIGNPMSDLFSGLASPFKKKGMRRGGEVLGDKGGEDENHIKVSRGEFIVNRNAVRSLKDKFGRGFLDDINKFDGSNNSMAKFSDNVLVGSQTSSNIRNKSIPSASETNQLLSNMLQVLLQIESNTRQGYGGVSREDLENAIERNRASSTSLIGKVANSMAKNIDAMSKSSFFTGNSSSMKRMSRINEFLKRPLVLNLGSKVGG